MNKTIAFVKKYWIWIAIGILLGLAIALLALFSIQKNEPVEVRKILNPYLSSGNSPEIELITSEQEFGHLEKIYKVSKPPRELFTNFADNFFSMESSFSLDEDITLSSGNNLLTYISSSGVLLFFTEQEGVAIDIKMSSARDIKTFFNHYFGISQVDNVKVQETEDTIEYRGYYQYAGESIGSSDLEGYAYIVIFDSLGRLEQLQMLLVRESDIEYYQSMQTINISDILSVENYPMKIVNTQIEERYYDALPLIRASAKLSSISIRELSLVSIFNTYEVPYLLPTFVLHGDGRLDDSQGDSYWTRSVLYMCGIDPESLYVREDNTYFNPVPYVPE